MAFKRIKLVISPVSRPSWVRRYIPGVVDVFESAGIEVEKVVTQCAGDLARLVKEADCDCDAVVIAGGDGSINEALNVLHGSSMPVGIIPFGTVNVFAREMGIPLHPVKAARAFLAGNIRSFDLGRVAGRYFFLMVSFGFDVFVLRRNPSFLKKIFGRYAFVLTGIYSIPFFKEEPIEVYLDDEKTSFTAYFAVFSNARYYAGEYLVAPKADMNDGLLDVVLFSARGPLGIIRVVASFMKGTHLKKSWVKVAQCRRIRFKTRAKDYFQVDGDPFEVCESEITIERSAIRVVVP